MSIKYLNILEQWFIISATCVKWNGHVSHLFRLLACVRQGGVLSPFLFAIFIDSVAMWLIKLELLMRVAIFPPFMSIILYAHEILLIAPSIMCCNV